MRRTLEACPRILDIIAQGALADPNQEAIIYLRAALDSDPVVYTNDHFVGCIKATATWFRSQGIGKNDAVAVLLPACPGAIAAIFGAAACGIVEPLNLLFTREAIAAQLKALDAKLLVAPPPGTPGGLHEKVAGLEKEVPSLTRIVTVPIDGSISLDSERLEPDETGATTSEHARTKQKPVASL
jgi:fatty-acyl-CoA synthase